MNILIDCRMSDCLNKIYSVSLFERILRQIHELGYKTSSINMLSSSSLHPYFRKEFTKRYKLNIQNMIAGEETEAELRKYIQSDKYLILLEGNAIYDNRILEKLLNGESNISITDPTSNETPVAACIQSHHLQAGVNNGLPVIESIKQMIPQHTECIPIQSMNTYVKFLRRDIPPVFLKITGQSNLRKIENDLYHKTFKGAMEFVAIYGYRIPVRELTRFVARTCITPNQITTLAIISSFAAIPCFYLGWFWAGILLAANFIIMDSLDGKLARMTIRLSHAADRWDHLTSLPTRMGWYSGMGWYFALGDIHSPVIYVAMIMTLTPFLDKMLLNFFNYKFGRSPLDYTELDRKVHLFTVRRNDIFVMILGSATGHGLETYFFITAWAVFTLLWHLFRTFWFMFKTAQ